MASWHENEPLDEAIWFFLNSTFPDDEVFESCKSGLALVVGHPHSSGDVRRLLVESRAA
jgi:hypothetical protein